MAKVIRNPDVLWRRESDDSDAAPEDAVAAILFSGGSMLSLNEFGIELWEMCEGQTVDEMVASLLSEFEVEEDALRSDIQNFLNSLLQKGFIRYE